MARILSSSVFEFAVSSRAFVAMASSGAACGSAKSVYHLDTSVQLSKLLTADAGVAVEGPYLTARRAASERMLGLAGSSSTRGRFFFSPLYEVSANPGW